MHIKFKDHKAYYNDQPEPLTGLAGFLMFTVDPHVENFTLRDLWTLLKTDEAFFSVLTLAGASPLSEFDSHLDLPPKNDLPLAKSLVVHLVTEVEDEEGVRSRFALYMQAKMCDTPGCQCEHTRQELRLDCGPIADLPLSIDPEADLRDVLGVDHPPMKWKLTLYDLVMAVVVSMCLAEEATYGFDDEEEGDEDDTTFDLGIDDAAIHASAQSEPAMIPLPPSTEALDILPASFIARLTKNQMLN